MKSNNKSPEAASPMARSHSFATESAAPAAMAAPSAPSAPRTSSGLKPIGPVLAGIIAGLREA